MNIQAKNRVRRSSYYFIIPFLLLVFTISGYGQDHWKLIKEKSEIKVFTNTKNSDSKLIHIKAISSVNGSLEDCYNLIKDVDNYKSWMHGAEQISLIERKSPDEFSYYMLTDFPWPANDRDVIIRTKVHFKKKKRVVYTVSRNRKNVIPEKEDIHRVEKMRASWEFKEIDAETIQIIYEGHIHSSIELPDWLEERISYRGPFNTIKNMKKEIQSGKYTSYR